MGKAAPLLGVSERQGWRLLAAYRKEGARGLVHKNRGRVPPNATPEAIQQRVVALTQERYLGINHTQLTECWPTGGTDVVPAHGKADSGTGRVVQPPPPSATTTSVSQATDASGRDAAPAGWEPPPLAGGSGTLADLAAGGGRRYRDGAPCPFQEQEDTRATYPCCKASSNVRVKANDGIHRWACCVPAPA